MKRIKTLLCLLLAAALCLCAVPGTAFAEEGSAAETAAALLNAVDTLAEMQAKRSACGSAEEYEAYLEDMFAQREEALAAYEALTEEEQAEVAALVADLEDVLLTELPTTWNFRPGTVDITEGDGAYVYQVIFKRYTSYEASHHYTAGQDVAQTIMLVDTREEAGNAWSPDGPYSYNENNYLLTYCCDLVHPTVDGVLYKRVNLEDSGYYDANAAAHIRAIVQASYPFVSMEEMKASLKKNGFAQADELNRGEIIAAVQMAIWAYSNETDEEAAETIADAIVDGGVFNYNTKNWCNPWHDYQNELWDWWNGGNMTPSPEASARVDALTEYLCKLKPVSAKRDQIIISSIELVKSTPSSVSPDTYQMMLKIRLNGMSKEGGNAVITVTPEENGAPVSIPVEAGKDQYYVTVEAKYGDTVNVTVDGTQVLSKGVYYYEPLGGRSVSQCLVGMAEGSTMVHAEDSFLLKKPPTPPEEPPTPPEEPPTPPEEPPVPPEEPPIEEDDLVDDEDGSLSPYDDSPLTGDTRNTAVWEAVSLLSLLGIAVLANGRRRREK